MRDRTNATRDFPDATARAVCAVAARKNRRLGPWCRSFGSWVALASFALASCDRAPPAAVTPQTLVVFATLYPLADIARQVGGDRVRADWLIDLGDPIDTFTPDDNDRARMAGVDYLLADSSSRTEIWAQRELDRRHETGTTLGVDQTPDAWQSPSDGLLVLDPVLAGEYARVVAKTLSRRLPDAAADFRGRADAFVAKLDAVVAAFKAPPGAQAVVLSGLFDPLLARVGVKPILVSADPLRFTQKDAESVRRAAADSGAKSLLVPFDTPAGTQAYLEELTGLRVFALDALGYPNYQQHAGYLDVLAYDLGQLKLATGG